MNQWHNCPNLAAFWYNTISAILYFYTLYTSGVRYHLSKTNTNDPRYGQEWNERYMLIHLACILLSSLLWLVFIFSSLFKTGNLANDYVEISSFRSIIGAPHITWSVSLIFRKVLSRLKYHLIPFNSTIHLCGAFFLLIPIPLMVDEDTKHGVSNTDNRSIDAMLTVYTPEIINFLLAAVSMIVRLPTVFLVASSPISIVFSFFLFFANLNILIRCVFHQILPLKKISYNIVEIEILDVAIFLLAIFNFSLIYEMARTRYIDLSYKTKQNSQNQSSPKSAIMITKRPNILRFWPNLLSTNMLIISIILIIQQYTLTYIMMPIFFFDLIFTVWNYLNWLIILLLFTFKSDWHFKYHECTTKIGILSRQPSLQVPHLNLKPGDTTYTCFQPVNDVRSVSSESSRTPNQDFSSASSSSGSHTSERILSQKHIPSISKQLEVPELNYDEFPTYKSVNRPGRNLLREITEENVDQIGYFKSPNISQRSSNLHSSDSGIGINYREHMDYNTLAKSPDYDTPRSRPMTLQRHMGHEYDINEELMGTVNICSDV